MLADKLIEKTGYEIQRFDELPETHQKAIVWYMAIDGEAWDLLGSVASQPFGDRNALKSAIAEELHLYRSEYGDTKFGVASIPTDTMKSAIAESPSFLESYPSWEAFNESCNTAAILHPATDRWPSILSSFDDEILQDGWHRCFSYMASGHEDIPVIFYPNEQHLKAKAGEDNARDIWNVPVASIYPQIKTIYSIPRSNYTDEVIELAAIIKESGISKSLNLKGYPDEMDGKNVVVIQGSNRTLTALGLAISEGAEINTVPVYITEKPETKQSRRMKP